MTTQTWWTQGTGLVDEDDMRRFMKECIMKAGAPERHALELANVLVAADCRGHFSQGLNHLELQVKLIMRKQCDPSAVPTVIKETPASALVHGHNGLGPVVANFCMRLAIRKARARGVGWVTAKGSNDYGFSSYYSMQAARKGMIGFVCTNTAPFMPAPGSNKPFVGTNPMSFAAPAQYGESIVLGMPCSQSSFSEVELKRRLQERLPGGWALDGLGAVTSCPVEATRARSLLPLGAEFREGHKGFGMALMLDILCGVLSGGPSGPSVRNWRTEHELPMHLSQTFWAIDPKRFAPNFEPRLYDLMYRLRGQDPVDLKKRVLVPGDPERAHLKQVRHRGGIVYPSNLLKHALALAAFLEVEPITIK